MSTILAELREGDHFNIITFSDRVHTWRRGRTVRATRQNVRDARDFVKRIIAEGCESRPPDRVLVPLTVFLIGCFLPPRQGPTSTQLCFRLPSSSTPRPRPGASRPTASPW